MAELRTKQAAKCEELNTLTELLSVPAADFGAFLSFFNLCSPILVLFSAFSAFAAPVGGDK